MVRSASVCLLVAVGLLAVPASAVAQPPANDNVADAQVIGGPSPIWATGTTVGATREPWETLPEEMIPVSEENGTVWYRWAPGESSYARVLLEAACEGETSTWIWELSVFAQPRSGGGGFDKITTTRGNCNLAVWWDALRSHTYWLQVDTFIGYPLDFRFELTYWPDALLDGIDQFSCHGRPATIVDSFRGGPGHGGFTYGTPGNDVIVARGSEGLVKAGAGDDLICVLDGAWIDAGEGNDVVIGSATDDTIYGGGGEDTIIGGGGADEIYGGSAPDMLIGGNGYDVISGDGGADQVLGGKGRDELDGGGDEDHLEGSLGHDTLIGRAGNDELEGGDGFDRIEGLAGHDEIVGFKGNDNLTGGEGDDVFSAGGGFDRCTLEDVERPAGCELERAEAYD